MCTKDRFEPPDFFFLTILKVLDGSGTEAEKAAVGAWREDDKENDDFYRFLSDPAYLDRLVRDLLLESYGGKDSPEPPAELLTFLASKAQKAV